MPTIGRAIWDCIAQTVVLLLATWILVRMEPGAFGELVADVLGWVGGVACILLAAMAAAAVVSVAILGRLRRLWSEAVRSRQGGSACVGGARG